MDINESNEEAAGASSLNDAGDKHTYEVLGHDTFNCAELEFIEGLHPSLAQRVKQHLKRWYPVQTATLPHLIAATNACTVLPPRDLVISAPTGSGKTLCYVIPILNALRSQTSGSLFALVVAPVQNLVDQIEKVLLFSVK
ncbi:unnamed protein product [Gongylonema pulchrum]|uniref:ATP-dependent RNA helicase n=1 Tax=Gongylonema pulchrum TaxID=637853 RepID=A0A183CZX8_9BILA|nr:unnamed protein product [Gongylonema pulchrum]